jgi:hypothetical protein
MMVTSSPLQDTAVVGLSLSIVVSAAVLGVPRIAPTIGSARDSVNGLVPVEDGIVDDRHGKGLSFLRAGGEAGCVAGASRVHAFNGETAARVIVYEDRAITAACAGDVAFMVPPVPATQ